MEQLHALEQLHEFMNQIPGQNNRTIQSHVCNKKKGDRRSNQSGKVGDHYTPSTVSSGKEANPFECVLATVPPVLQSVIADFLLAVFSIQSGFRTWSNFQYTSPT